MLTAHPSTVVQKRDLHVGGVGSTLRENFPPAATHIFEDSSDRAEFWMDRARDAERFIRANPWTAVALVGLAGIATGIAVSRRGRA